MRVPTYYWCHKCGDWRFYDVTASDECVCRRCGETMLCDECGQPWPACEAHEHEG